jgi:8-oxo-dGTP pyrophosphatase MutT (NUDIX family)
MSIDILQSIFQHRKGEPIGNFKKNSVMILLSEENHELYIWFEVRSEKLNHQPGDVCLPGGKIDKNETPFEAAGREVMEELSISEKDFDILGEMDYFISPYGSIMYPYVGILKRTDFKPNHEEVKEMFKVPLSFFLNAKPLTYEMNIGPHLTEEFPYHLVRGGRDYKFSKGKLTQYFYEYEGHIIWGFTALIITRFIEIVKKAIY